VFINIKGGLLAHGHVKQCSGRSANAEVRLSGSVVLSFGPDLLRTNQSKKTMN
jgi:hypothetical protein